jgi:hypothetical protein
VEEKRATDYSFIVRDITPFLIRDTAHTSPRRGTAIIYFRGPVPDSFQVLVNDTESHNMTDGTNSGLSMEIDAGFIGATQLYEPPPEITIKADIVAIHGLNGHPCGSWLSKSPRPAMWLQDFLPEDIPNCRIILYGYKSNIFDDKAHPRHELFTQAERLNATLNNIRPRDVRTSDYKPPCNLMDSNRVSILAQSSSEPRPIIFLAHSYGGLILARVCLTLLFSPPPRWSHTCILRANPNPRFKDPH